MGSVKDLRVVEEPSGSSLGVAHFVFSDRYSVFDWGEMPDHLREKGAALAMMGAYNFELLEEQGVSTHYRGMVQGSEEVSVADLSGPAEQMSIALTRKPRVESTADGYEYEDLADAGNYLIPLEVMFRNAVPIGSSVRRRYSPRDVGIDADEWPDRNVELDEPIIDFSTKLEEQDRYIDGAEARQLAGLDRDEFERMKELAREVNRVLTERAAACGLEHLDGKIELVYHDGDILVADVAGTLDENRFACDGVQLSKEMVRQWYKANDPDWYEEVSAAKQRAEEDGAADWKQFVDREPVELDPEMRRLVEQLYTAAANRWLGRDVFDTPPLDDVVEELRRLEA